MGHLFNVSWLQVLTDSFIVELPISSVSTSACSSARLTLSKSPNAFTQEHTVLFIRCFLDGEASEATGRDLVNCNPISWCCQML